ncbi:hypothetical protein ACQ4PT_026974 [Festuca glaucescens]
MKGLLLKACCLKVVFVLTTAQSSRIPFEEVARTFGLSQMCKAETCAVFCARIYLDRLALRYTEKVNHLSRLALRYTEKVNHLSRLALRYTEKVNHLRWLLLPFLSLAMYVMMALQC